MDNWAIKLIKGYISAYEIGISTKHTEYQMEHKITQVGEFFIFKNFLIIG